jgi:hypothetical protein
MTESTQTAIAFLCYVAIVICGCGWLVMCRKITRIEFVICLVIVFIQGAILYPIFNFQQNREIASRKHKKSNPHQVRE